MGWELWTVWPDARIKSSPIVTLVAQKGAKAVFYTDREVFKIKQKVAKYLG